MRSRSAGSSGEGVESCDMGGVRIDARWGAHGNGWRVDIPHSAARG
jgi:hypothetical protein